MPKVYTPFLLQKKKQKFNYGPYCNGNGVYQKCIHRSRYSKRSRNSTMDHIVMGTVYNKSVYTVPVTVKEAEIQLWTLL